MKRIAVILGIMFIGIIALLETSNSKNKKQMQFMPGGESEYDDVWWDN